MANVIPDTSARVPQMTNGSSNKKIREYTIQKLKEVGTNRPRIENRLQELEREWDIERTLEANAATVALVGLALGVTVNRKWLILPSLVGGFLLQHALQGWCPPLPFFRWLGVRTQREIDNERAVLKSRRGDLKRIKDNSETALSAFEH